MLSDSVATPSAFLCRGVRGLDGLVAITAGAMEQPRDHLEALCQRAPLHPAQGSVPALTRVPRPGEGLTLSDDDCGLPAGCRCHVLTWCRSL